MRYKSVLVTGATGFIGSHLLALLDRNQYRIKASTRKTLSANSPNITTIKINDINGTTDWQEALAGIDCVIHLAGRAHVLKDTSIDPEAEFYRINVLGTSNLVKQAIATNVKRFIFMSSVGAMANSSNVPLTESSPCSPESPYGRSKLKAEKTLKELCKNSPMSWTILRPPLVYGPGNPGNMVRLLKLVQSELPLPLGAVNNRRSFLYVGNLVDAIETCINHPNAENQTFLVTDGEDLSTPTLITKIAQSMNHKNLLFPVPLALIKAIGLLSGKRDATARLTDSLSLDSRKINSILEWHPPISVDQGVRDTVEWFLKSAV